MDKKQPITIRKQFMSDRAFLILGLSIILTPEDKLNNKNM